LPGSCATYCGSVGVEFMHIQDPAQKSWIQDRIESAQNRTEFTREHVNPPATVNVLIGFNLGVTHE
jgi:hypothetical protein